MTAALRTPRPTLYLVPHAGGRPRPADPAAPVAAVASRPVAAPAVGAAGALAASAGEVAARALGTLFAPVAAGVAQALASRAPGLVRRARPELWAAAIVFLLAEQSRLFEYDCCSTRTSLARELGTTLPTLRRRAADVRLALHPLVLEVPDPVFE